MCGHFGMAGIGIIQEDLNIFRDLGCISDIYRGGDGSGVYQVNSRSNSSKYKNNYEYLHKTMFPFSVMLYDLDVEASDTPELKTFLSSCVPDVFIGHVRAATLGKISHSNAHPFSFQNIVGAHNGTLKDSKYIDTRKENALTDSELLFSDINQRGIVSVINELDPNSAYAIVQYDRHNRKIHLYRNDKRPLYVAFNEERNVLYWASEAAFLRFVLNRRVVRTSICALRSHMIYEIDPQTVNKSRGTGNLRVIHKFPEAIKFDEEQKKKKEEEELKKSQEEAAVKKNWASEEVAKIFADTLDKTDTAPVKHSVGNNILSFAERKKINDSKQNSIKTFYEKCACGSVTFNLVQCNLARRGKQNSSAIYDNETNKFYCIGCDPKKTIQEVNKNVLH